MLFTILGPVVPLRGGIAQYTTLLAEALEKREPVRVFSFSRLFPSFLYPGRSQRQDKAMLATPANVEFCLDSVNPITWKRTANKIIASKPDLLIVPLWTTFLVPTLYSVVSVVKRHTATKVLFICHNVMPHDVSNAHLQVMKALLKRGDFALVHSDYEREMLGKEVPRLKVVKHFHPIYEFFARPAQVHDVSDEDARSNLRIPKDKLLMLFFGFVRPYKGLGVLLRAMPEILKSVDASLLIVGEFWKRREPYDRAIADLGIVDSVRIIDRYVPDNEVALYFRASDVVVLPYREATQSGVVQIAYGFRKPVITSDVGGLPEVVEDGKTGYVVSREDPAKLAAAVLRFAEDRGRVDFTSNIEAIADRFSWDRLCEVIMGVCE